MRDESARTGLRLVLFVGGCVLVALGLVVRDLGDLEDRLRALEQPAAAAKERP